MRSVTVLVPFLAAMAEGFSCHDTLRVNTLTTPVIASKPSLPPGTSFEINRRIPRTTTLHALTGSVTEAELTDNGNNLGGRQIFSMVGYRVLSLIYLFLSLFLTSWQGSKSLASLPLTCYVTAGPMLAAGVSYVLEGGAVNNRLNSDTYKRLNLFLAQYGLLWLVGAYLVRKTPSKIVTNQIMLVASGIAVINGLQSWIYGVTGRHGLSGAGNSLARELVTGIKKTTEIIFSRKTLSGLVYFWACTMTLGLKVSKILDICMLVKGGTATGAMLCKDVLQFSMYALLNGALFTLKDGAGTNI